MKNNKKFNKRPNNQGNPYNILPPTDVLEQYEDMAPGSVEELVKMAKKEQEHRHGWQEKHLLVHGRIHKWGQIFAFIYNVILLFAVWNIAQSGNKDLALKIFVVNAAIIIFALLVTFIERRIMNRRPPRRFPRKNNNHNPKTK